MIFPFSEILPGSRDRTSLLISPPRHPLQVMNAGPIGFSTTFGSNSPLSTSDVESNRLSSASIRSTQIRQYGLGHGSNSFDANYGSPGFGESTNTPNSRSSWPGAKSHCKSPSVVRSPALERLLKKISKKNGKGETPLHTAAIRGKERC